MTLLRDAPYHRLCPPSAHSDSMNSLYPSQATPCALGFAKIEGEMFILPPYHTTISQGAATIALLCDTPYYRMCPPGAHFDSMNSLYTSEATPCAVGFAKAEGVTIILLPFTIHRGTVDDSTTI